jgi:hypothetical protein
VARGRRGRNQKILGDKTNMRGYQSLRSHHRSGRERKIGTPIPRHRIKVPRGPIHERDPAGRSDEMLQKTSDDMSYEDAQVPAENVLNARPSSAEVPLEHEKEPKMLIAAFTKMAVPWSEADDSPFHPRGNGREPWQKSGW